MREEILLKANIEEMAHFIKMNQILQMPTLVKFSNSNDYRGLTKIKKAIPDSRIAVKLLKELSKYEDYKEVDIATGNLMKLIKACNRCSPEIIGIIRQFIPTIHQLQEVLPDLTGCNPYKILLILQKIKGYKRETFLELLSFIHYKKIQNLIMKENIKTILFKLEKIKESNYKRTETLEYKKEYGENYKTFLDAKRKNEYCIYTYVKDMMFDDLKITKDKVEASFWGQETKCCLKKGGAAESLLEVISKSPIACEIVGTLNGNKMSSYTWDMVECINGKAYKTLILDNIESPVKINEKDTEYLFDKLHSFNKYKNIYLGTIRNDCTVNEKYKTKPRQSLIPGFDDLFRKSIYTHADSDIVFKMRTHRENKNIEVRKMNVSDLHLCKYIENYIYGKELYNGSNDKTDILKQVSLDTPCYILDSTTNIYGYMLTKWKYFDEFNTECFSDKGIKKFYIEDLVVARNKTAISKLTEVFNDLEQWLKDNEITEVYLHTNKNSKNFKKRLEKAGIKVIEENLCEIEPVNYLM